MNLKMNIVDTSYYVVPGNDSKLRKRKMNLRKFEYTKLCF